MKNSIQTFLKAAAFFALLGSEGCKQRAGADGGQGVPPLSGTPAVGTDTTGGGSGRVTPPVPVLGSYLVAELRRDDGTPIARAKVDLLGEEATTSTPSALNLLTFALNLSASGVLFQTESNDAGKVSLPVSKIRASNLDFRIQDANRVINSSVSLPGDVAQAVSQKRVDEGLTALPNYPAQPSPPSADGSVAEPVALDRKLALQVPENRVATTTGGAPTSTTVEEVTITPVSLPNNTEPAAKTVDVYTLATNISTDTTVRFAWQNAFADSADVRIAYSFSESTMSAWDGLAGTYPSANESATGINFVSDYQDCSDSAFRTAASGPMKSTDGATCGFLRNQFPFNNGSDVFVRIAGESATAVKLSTVFRIKFNNTAPTLAALANKTVPINTSSIEVALVAQDTESALSCGSSVSARSDNSALLPNQNIVLGGTFPNCKLLMYPKPGVAGISQISVIVTDGSLTASRSFTLDVANYAPTDITLSNSTIAEHTSIISVGSLVGTLGAIARDPNSVFTYSVGGADGSYFAVSYNLLVTSKLINFENKQNYSITITVRDQELREYTKIFVVNATNLNESPTNITLSQSSVSENVALGSTVATITIADQDIGDTQTLLLGGPDSSAFTIVGNTLRTNSIVNYESKTSYSISIRTTDAAGLSFLKSFTISVVNLGEPATDIVLSSSIINENQPVGTTVGTLRSVDPDYPDPNLPGPVTYTLSGPDASSFSINGTTLRSAAVFQKSIKSSYEIIITATDTDGSQFVKGFLITVNEANAPTSFPPTNIVLSRSTVWENAGTNAVVGALSAVDMDSTAADITFTLVAGDGDSDNASFNISSKKLQANLSLDFELQDVFSVRVRATDEAGVYFEKAMTVNVIDVVEDEYFDNVVLLAHLDGAQGSTTYTDSSKFKRTLTNSSTTGHTSSISRFGNTSLQIKNGYVSVSGVNIASGVDFTMEGWWYRTVDLSYGPKMLFYTSGNPDTTKSNTRFTLQDGTSLMGVTTTNTSDTNVLNPVGLSTSPTVALNTWHHVALSRQSGTLRLFLNGSLVKSANCSDCFTNNGTLQFARSHLGLDGGFVDELRLTMNVARYVTNFTPPSTPFPDDAPPSFIPSLLGPTYSQSSTHPDSTAVQNAFLTDASILGGVAATNAETGGWIKMDLKRNYLIDRVVIGTSRSTATAPLDQKSLTENKLVEYSLDGFAWKTAFTTGTLPEFGIYKFDVDFHARYLRIKSTSGSPEVLAVSEFHALSPGQFHTPGDFTPRNVVPVAWYDASDASTVHLDSPAGTSDSVVGWSDKSIWRRDLAQTNPANRTGIGRSAFNGRNALRWPTTDNNKFLEHTGSVTTSEIYAVGRFASPTGTNFTNNEGLISPRNNLSSSWMTAFGSSAGFNVTSFVYLFLNAFNDTNRVDSLFPEINSLSLMRTVTESSNPITSANGITVGIDRLQTSQGRGWKGEISELLLFSPPLTTDNRGNLERYLATKWNLTSGSPPPANPIKFVGMTKSTVPTISTAAPAHNVGDLLVVISSTADSRPVQDFAGFTVLFSAGSTNWGSLIKIQWKIATGTSLTLPPFGSTAYGSDQLSILVYSNATIGASASSIDPSVQATFPYVEFNNPDTSWALRILGKGSGYSYQLPAPGYFHRDVQYFANISDSADMTTSPTAIAAPSSPGINTWAATIELKRKP